MRSPRDHSRCEPFYTVQTSLITFFFRKLVTGRTWRGVAFGGVKGRSELPTLVDGAAKFLVFMQVTS